MTTFVMRDGRLTDKRTGEALKAPNRIAAPMVMSDIPEYRSPIDGKLIGSRSQQREDLKANDCVLLPPRQKPRGYRNPNFARKRGLKLAED